MSKQPNDSEKHTVMKHLYYIIIIVALTLCSCVKRVHLDEVQKRGYQYFYRNAPFTGEIWSGNYEDVRQETAEGFVVRLTAYHENGKVAIEMTLDKELSPEFKCFNEDGDEITQDDFESRYQPILKKINDLQK